MYEYSTLIRANIYIELAIRYPEIQNSKGVLVADERPKYLIECSADLGQTARSPVYVQVLAISTASTVPPYRLGDEPYHLYTFSAAKGRH
jgi:hypothetical protein